MEDVKWSFEGEAVLNGFVSLPFPATLVLNREGIIVKWNTRAGVLYGGLIPEGGGISFSKLFIESDLSKTFLERLKVPDICDSFTLQGWQSGENGSSFHSEVSVSPLKDSAGIPAAFMVSIRDITAEEILRKKNETFKRRLEVEVSDRTRELQIANEELEAFSYSVSHDLRAPLRAVNGFSQVLLDDYRTKLDAEGLRLLEVVHWNATLMGKLIDDLLKYSRLSKLDLKADLVNMNSVIKTVLSVLVVPITDNRYDIRVGSLLPAYGDSNMFLQVWMNLIDNSLKYTSKVPHPLVEIGCTENDTSITYYIKDNGAGFDMKYIDKLFGVFQRLHTQDEFPGTGLGLALVKRIISKHSGEVFAQSTVNQGTEISFKLPKKRL